MVFANQVNYYQAIEQSSKNADCASFIEFMLGEILAALKKHRQTVRYRGRLFLPIQVMWQLFLRLNF